MKKEKLTQTQVLNLLEPSKKKMIYTTVRRYENGALSSIFNESEVSALAEDVALEVARRVAIFNKSPRAREAVDPKGARAYFTRAFINHCQKIYEKHAKTDTRAGIQTVSSDEAMTVAASKNWTTPENKYLLNNELVHLITALEQKDKAINDRLQQICAEENRSPKPEEKLHSAVIILKMLEGFEPFEIRDLLKLSEGDYARHRKAALDLAKELMPHSLADLIPHFDSPMDYRVLTREVQKRKKSKNRIRNYSLTNHYFVESKFDKKSGTCQTILYVQIDVMEGESKSPDFKPYRAKLMEEKTAQAKASEIRQKFWTQTKAQSIATKVEALGQKLLKEGPKAA